MLRLITGPMCRLMVLSSALLLTLSGGILLQVYTWPVVALFCFVAWPRVRASAGWSHGTARMASYQELRDRKLLGKKGLAIGRASFTGSVGKWQALCALVSPGVSSADAVRMVRAAFWRGYDDSVIRIQDYVHAVTFAPTGSGKGTCAQIPNLFTYRGSMVVVDPQGTLYRVTGWFREKILGHRVIRMDPHGIAGPTADADCLNICDCLDPSQECFTDDARAYAELMVKRESNEFQPHFNDWAILILAAMLCYVCSCEPVAAKRTLSVVHRLVSSREKYDEAKAQMRTVPGDIGTMGGMLSTPADRELSAILATVQRHTHWITSPLIQACLSRSTWHPRLLRSGKVSVYLILPSHMLSTHAALLRLWIGVILQELARDGVGEQQPVLFMIDEAAHIGKIQKLEDAVTLMRAYGVRIWLFFQSVNQLQECYGNHAQTILDNMSIQQFFGTNAYESAEHISRRVGDCTILVQSINKNRSRTLPLGVGRDYQPGSDSAGSGTTTSEAGRRLFRTEEILVLPHDVSLTFHKNMHVIVSELVPYFADPAFKKPERIGRSPGVGIGAGVFSATALAISAMVLLLVASLAASPRQGSFEQPPFGSGGVATPLPYDGSYYPPVHPTPRRVPQRGRYRPSQGRRSGYPATGQHSRNSTFFPNR